MIGNSSDAKASASNSIPLPINEGAVAVPRDILRASDVVGEGNNPGKGSISLPRGDGHLDSKQAMKLEVPEPTIRNLIPHETGGGRRGGPPFGGAGAAAGKSVVKGADSVPFGPPGFRHKQVCDMLAGDEPKSRSV